ncbi:MAG TPA: hemolysin family protein [Chloroflexota bacterium]
MDAHWVEAIILILTFVLAAMSAAAETAFTALSPSVVHTLEQRGGVGKVIAYLRRDPNRFLSTILVVSSTSLIIASSMATLLFTSIWPRPWGELAATVGISIAVLIFAELTPKNIAVRQPQTVSLILARPVQIFSILLWPILQVTGTVVSVFMRLLGQGGGSHTVPAVTEDEFRSTLQLAENSVGGLSEEETERIEGILDLDKVVVDQVMRPRTDIVAVPVDMPLMDALDVVLREGHSRIPVYEESIDDVVGILYDKDLLKYVRENEVSVSLRDVARPAIFVPESKRADDLLREFQKRKVHMAIVFDEYGGTAGLVTIEDILEEIVGEIQDEYDAEEPLFQQINEDEWLVRGIARLEEVNEETGIELPTDHDLDTVGGFVLAELGEVAKVGDTVNTDHVQLEIVDVEGRRIKKVRLTRVPGEEPPGGEREDE